MTAEERAVLDALPDGERRRREGKVLDDYGNEDFHPRGYVVGCRTCAWMTWGTPDNLPVDFAVCDRPECTINGAET